MQNKSFWTFELAIQLGDGSTSTCIAQADKLDQWVFLLRKAHEYDAAQLPRRTSGRRSEGRSTRDSCGQDSVDARVAWRFRYSQCRTFSAGASFAGSYFKASGRLKTTSVMQTLSGLSGRLSQSESDLNLPPGGSSEARGGYESICRSPNCSVFSDDLTVDYANSPNNEAIATIS